MAWWWWQCSSGARTSKKKKNQGFSAGQTAMKPININRRHDKTFKLGKDHGLRHNIMCTVQIKTLRI